MTEETLKQHYKDIVKRISQGFEDDDQYNKGYWYGKLSIIQSLALDEFNRLLGEGDK